MCSLNAASEAMRALLTWNINISELSAVVHSL